MVKKAFYGSLRSLLKHGGRVLMVHWLLDTLEISFQPSGKGNGCACVRSGRVGADGGGGFSIAQVIKEDPAFARRLMDITSRQLFLRN